MSDTGATTSRITRYLWAVLLFSVFSSPSVIRAQKDSSGTNSKTAETIKKSEAAIAEAENRANEQMKRARAREAIENEEGLPSSDAYATALSPPDPGAASQVSTVAGRVFAITKGGDLKPARLAHVYLIPDSSMMTSNFSRYAKEWSDKLLKSQPALISSEIVCRTRLESIDRAVPDTLNWDEKWAAYPQGRQRIIGTEADEEGNFIIKGITPGSYSIAARGRVGIYDAYWNETITMDPNRVFSVKLAYPSTWCPEKETDQ